MHSKWRMAKDSLRRHVEVSSSKHWTGWLGEGSHFLLVLAGWLLGLYDLVELLLTQGCVVLGRLLAVHGRLLTLAGLVVGCTGLIQLTSNRKGNTLLIYKFTNINNEQQYIYSNQFQNKLFLTLISVMPLMSRCFSQHANHYTYDS